MTAWKRSTFVVVQGSAISRWKPEEVTVTGYVSGSFGIHHDRTVRKGWVITHLPTGRALHAGGLPFMDEAKRRVDLVRDLWDWETVTKENARQVPATARRILTFGE